MSEKELKAPSILLPPSIVAVFTRDSMTSDSAQACAKDWRFARVEIQVHDGDVETAINAYKGKTAPDLIIVQVPKIEDSLTDQLEGLAEHCSEGTGAIVIGPVNDVNLYRSLTDMGVSDYLVAPVKANMLAEVISETLTEQIGVADSKMIAFVGAKGGVGTSALAQATALGASKILKQKTILIDGAGGWSTHGVGMGYEPSTTLTQATRAVNADDDESLERMIVNVDDNLSVLGSGGDVMLENPIDPEDMETLVDKLKTKYPLVIADVSATASEVQKTILMQASRIVLVATPLLASLRQARTLLQEIKTLRDNASDEIDLIMNLLGLNKSSEVSQKDIQQALEMEPSALIKFMGDVFMKSESEGSKIIENDEGAKIIQESLLPIVHKTMGTKPSEAELVKAEKGFIDKLFKKKT